MKIGPLLGFVMLIGGGLYWYVLGGGQTMIESQQTVAIASASPDSSATDPADSAEPTTTEAPYNQSYNEGKVDGLPDAAKAVLTFEPVDSPDQTTSTSILERVASICGLDDYVGSGDFPGTIEELPPTEHGWVRVIWKPGKCGGAGGSVNPHPTLVFEISADLAHLRDIGGMDSDTYMLTH